MRTIVAAAVCFVSLSGPLAATPRGGTEEKLPLVAGGVAPDFALRALNGKRPGIELYSLRRYVGPKATEQDARLVLLGVVASWVNYEEQLFYLERAHRLFGASGLRVLGITVEVDEEAVAAARKAASGVGFPLLLDRTEGTTTRYLGRHRFPTFFLIAKNGRVVARFDAFAELIWAQLLEELIPRLPKGAPLDPVAAGMADGEGAPARGDAEGKESSSAEWAAELEKIAACIIGAREKLAKEPGNREEWLHLGQHRVELRQWQQAADAYGRALALRPGDATALCAQGAAFNALGKRERAIGNYRKGLASDPRALVCHVGLGVALADDPAGVPEAMELWKKVIALDPAGREAAVARELIAEVEGKGEGGESEEIDETGDDEAGESEEAGEGQE